MEFLVLPLNHKLNSQMRWTGNDFAYTVYRKLSVVQDSSKERFALTCKQFQWKKTSNWNRFSPLYESLLVSIDIWRWLSGRLFVGKQSGNTKAQEIEVYAFAFAENRKRFSLGGGLFFAQSFDCKL